MPRRDFLVAAPAGIYALTVAAKGNTLRAPGSPGATMIEAFSFEGVKLLESRWLDQVTLARQAYFDVPDENILKGYREAAGLPAPGMTLGGWCQKNSDMVFGQWLSGMARISRSTGDQPLREKASGLLSEFAKTVKPNGNCGMTHYPFDKLVCGLLDMHLYADHPEALPLLERVTDWASKIFSRENIPATPKGLYQGRPLEWYTLSENLYRAYQSTGNPLFRTFGAAWHYDSYWKKFADTSAPRDAHGVHAYSHVNTFGSAAMVYAVTGDPLYLRIIKNAYDFLQGTQCYATGGFGPREIIMRSDGGIAKALEVRYDNFENGCGSWAGFKLSRYLMQFTGEARYGDWIERLFYNGAGASLPFTRDGKNFYYADYRINGGMKVYNWETFTCCSGTYIQDVAEYHNLIYFKDPNALYVNLFVPSEVMWKRDGGNVKLVQQTRYPEEETSILSLSMEKKADFALKVRIPLWARDVAISVNDAKQAIDGKPGSWAVLKRTWSPGDRVQIRIPLPFRMVAVDRAHPNLIAVVRGPAVMVLESDYHEPALKFPKSEAELNRWMVADKTPGMFRIEPPGGRVRSKFRYYYEVGEGFPYRMHFDTKTLPITLW